MNALPQAIDSERAIKRHAPFKGDVAVRVMASPEVCKEFRDDRWVDSSAATSDIRAAARAVAASQSLTSFNARRTGSSACDCRLK